jgi:hypothetical protein
VRTARANDPGVNPETQSNCFVGNLPELAPNGVAPATPFTVTLYDSAGTSPGWRTIQHEQSVRPALQQRQAEASTANRSSRSRSAG